MVSRHPGAPCGSVLGRFMVLSSRFMGVLVQDRNLKIERATESWLRDIQGRPVARYWDVLCFPVHCSDNFSEHEAFKDRIAFRGTIVVILFPWPGGVCGAIE